MSAMVPYETGREVGLVESYRLNREARQRNAELERMSGRFALEESRRHLDAVSREHQQEREHRLEMVQQIQVGERATRAVHLMSGLVDYAVSEVAGDPLKAMYVEPILERAGRRLNDTV